MFSSSFARISKCHNTLCHVVINTRFAKFSQFSLDTVLQPRVVKNSRLHTDGCASLNFTREFSIRHARVAKRTVNSLLNKWCGVFEENNISEPRESIEFILAHYLKSAKVSDLYGFKWRNRSLTHEDVLKINEMCDKRLKKWPVQYILGEWQFRRLNLKLHPPVFIPRPETELLTEIVLRDIRENNVKEVLELCCGSGAISLALLDECPHITAVAVDKSQEACALTILNAHRNNLSERITVHQKEITSDSKDLSFCPEKGGFDVIVSNPPYIPSAEIPELQPEIILHEDHAALDGGRDGLTLINRILHVTAATRLLNPGGRLYLEVDPSHPTLLAARLHHMMMVGDTTTVKEDEGVVGGEQQATSQAISRDDMVAVVGDKLKLRKIHEDLAGRQRFVEIIKI